MGQAHASDSGMYTQSALMAGLIEKKGMKGKHVCLV